VSSTKENALRTGTSEEPPSNRGGDSDSSASDGAGRPRQRCACYPPAVLSHRLLVVALATHGFLVASSAHAGAWTKPAGGGYAKVGSSTFVSDHGFDERGERVEGDGFLLSAQTLYAYSELGLSDKLTLVGFVPYVIATNQHESGVNFHTLSTGDAMLGVQMAIFTVENVVTSARAEVKIPLYVGGPSIRGRQTARVPGYPRSAGFFPAVGDGQVDLTGFVSAGASLPWLNGFVTGDLGYRLRTGVITDAVLGNMTLGFSVLGGYVLLMVNSQSVLTLPATDEINEVVGKGYWAIGPAIMVRVWDGLSVEVGADLITRGVNAAGGVQLLAGVSYAF